MSVWLETRGYYLLGAVDGDSVGWLAWLVRSAAAKNDVERSPAAIRRTESLPAMARHAAAPE